MENKLYTENFIEIWKDIKGFEGIYKVSNKGKIKNKFNRIRKTKLNYENGYEYIGLRKEGKYYWKFVHKIVAETFIPNPKGYSIVNHIDEDKTDNRAENLEWCTQKYNMNYGTARLKISKGNSKKVYQYDLKGKLVNVFYGAREAGRILKIRHQGITACCRGEREEYKNYVWKYDLPKNWPKIDTFLIKYRVIIVL